MATSDHVPEVCFQASIFQVPVATLYFLSSQIYFIRFLGNEEQNLDSISCCSQCLFSWAYGDPDPSNFIHQETNQIPFKQSTVIRPPGAPKLPSETGPKYLRDGEIGFAGCPRKRVEIRSFMIGINAWHFRCLEWRGMIHS